MTVRMHSEGRAFLRHSLAVLAYRGTKVLRDPPPEFAGFRIHGTSRSPAEILAHIGDLLDWALSMARGQEVWHDSRPLPWAQEVDASQPWGGSTTTLGQMPRWPALSRSCFKAQSPTP